MEIVDGESAPIEEIVEIAAATGRDRPAREMIAHAAIVGHVRKVEGEIVHVATVRAAIVRRVTGHAATVHRGSAPAREGRREIAHVVIVRKVTGHVREATARRGTGREERVVGMIVREEMIVHVAKGVRQATSAHAETSVRAAISVRGMSGPETSVQETNARGKIVHGTTARETTGLEGRSAVPIDVRTSPGIHGSHVASHHAMIAASRIASHAPTLRLRHEAASGRRSARIVVPKRCLASHVPRPRRRRRSSQLDAPVADHARSLQPSRDGGSLQVGVQSRSGSSLPSWWG